MAIDLSSIQKGRRLKRPKVTRYGVGGIGKTTFGASAPNPIFIMTEEGQGALDIQRFEPRENDPVIKSWPELMECIDALINQDHGYQTVVIDTIDFAEPLLFAYTAAKYNKENIEAFGYGKGYIMATDEFRALLAKLDYLRDTKGMIVILIAHSQSTKFASPTSDTFDRWTIKMHQKLADLVHDWSDAVLFFNFREHIVKEDAGFNKTRARAVGQGERVMYTEARPAWMAKNRYRIPQELVIPEGNTEPWLIFQNAVAEAQTAQLPKGVSNG